MKKCLKRKLYISKIWTKMVFKSFSFEVKMKEKNWVYRINVELQSIYESASESLSLSPFSLMPSVRRRPGDGKLLRSRTIPPPVCPLDVQASFAGAGHASWATRTLAKSPRTALQCRHHRLVASSTSSAFAGCKTRFPRWRAASQTILPHLPCL